MTEQDFEQLQEAEAREVECTRLDCTDCIGEAPYLCQHVKKYMGRMLSGDFVYYDGENWAK